MSNRGIPALDRFMKYVAKSESGCWEWTGHRKSNGYGEFSLNLRPVMAHRAAWTLMRGAIPAGLTIDHFVCSNRGCVNPEHLKVVTYKENVLRGMAVSAVNARKTHCVRGHAFSVENTAWHKGHLPGNLTRVCKTCQRLKEERINADPVKREKSLARHRLNARKRRAITNNLTRDFLLFGLHDHQNLLPGAKAATG